MGILNHGGISHSHGRLYFSKDNCNNKSHFLGSSVMWPVTSPSAGGVSLPLNLEGGAFTALAERPWWEWENGSQQVITLLLCSLGRLYLGPWGCYAVREPDLVEGTHTRQRSSQLSPGARCGSPRGFQPPSLQRHPQVWSCLSWDLRHPGTESTQPLCALFKCLICRIHDHIKLLLF